MVHRQDCLATLTAVAILAYHVCESSDIEFDTEPCSRFVSLRIVSPEAVSNTMLKESGILELQVDISQQPCEGDQGQPPPLTVENFQLYINEAEWFSLRLQGCVGDPGLHSRCTLLLEYMDPGPKRISVAVVDGSDGSVTEDSVFFFADADKHVEQMRERNPWMLVDRTALPEDTSVLLENVALHKPAVQQSTALGRGAELAVDGNTECDFQAGSCSHTGSVDGLSGTLDPWWTVDLEEIVQIHHIRILNRGLAPPSLTPPLLSRLLANLWSIPYAGDCCWERLAGFSITISNVTEWGGPVIGSVGWGRDVAGKGVQCRGAHAAGGRSEYVLGCQGVGQRVTVMVPGFNRVLSMCEVEVWASRAPSPTDAAAAGSDAVIGLVSHSSADKHLGCSPVSLTRARGCPRRMATHTIRLRRFCSRFA
eukprot:3935880-Rhodomonas_salina.3